MKRYKCIKAIYKGDTIFAKPYDDVVLLQDNTTVVNLRTQGTSNKPEILDEEHFESLDKKVDMVNHPPHYTWLKDVCGIEVIDITRHMDFNLGNAIKYILRSGKKNSDKTIEDLEKAVFYLNDEIIKLKKHELESKY
jgi:hypothetical protein